MGTVAAFGDPPPGEAVAQAVRALSAGQVVAMPTDTVYGLAADPFSTGGADRLFLLKRRPREHDLPVLVCDEAQALAMATAVPASARVLMERFWPGALTVVLPRRPDLRADLGADDATVGVRCPAHPVPLAVARAHGPIATTSANHHGEPTATSAAEVVSVFGDTVAVVLDGGPCEGAPSTVVDCTGPHPRLLREGRIPWAEVLAAASA